MPGYPLGYPLGPIIRAVRLSTVLLLLCLLALCFQSNKTQTMVKTDEEKQSKSMLSIAQTVCDKRSKHCFGSLNGMRLPLIPRQGVDFCRSAAWLQSHYD
eukprot:5222349-Amphidinium_carterae.1